MITVSKDACVPLRRFAGDPALLAGLPRLPVCQGDVAAIEALRKQIPGLPAGMFTFWSGPHPAGAQVELINVNDRIPMSAYADHCGLMLTQGILHDLGIPVALAGAWDTTIPGNMQMAFFYNVGTSRLMVVPSLRLMGRTLSVQLAHVVWCWQGWMVGHDPNKDEDWMDLSTNYKAYFFREGYAYREATVAFAQGRCFWGFYRSWFDRLVGMTCGRWTDLGKGEVVFAGPDVAPQPMLMSKELNSFFHFGVGEPLCPNGSEAGIILQRLRIYIASLTKDWRTYYGEGPEVEPRSHTDRDPQRRISERE